MTGYRQNIGATTVVPRIYLDCWPGVASTAWPTLYLTNRFVRRRGLALSIAFSGVRIGSITILPWLGSLTASTGWRAARAALGLMVLVLLAPLNLLLKRKVHTHKSAMRVRPEISCAFFIRRVMI